MSIKIKVIGNVTGLITIVLVRMQDPQHFNQDHGDVKLIRYHLLYFKVSVVIEETNENTQIVLLEFTNKYKPIVLQIRNL